MHKIAQKVTSIALAASMLLSMFATNTVAFADEFTDSTTVSEDATEAPASGEVDAVESVDETDTDNPEAVDEPTETPEPTPPVTDVVDLTHDSTTDTVKDDTTGGEDVVLTNLKRTQPRRKRLRPLSVSRLSRLNMATELRRMWGIPLLSTPC